VPSSIRHSPEPTPLATTHLSPVQEHALWDEAQPLLAQGGVPVYSAVVLRRGWRARVGWVHDWLPTSPRPMSAIIRDECRIARLTRRHRDILGW